MANLKDILREEYIKEVNKLDLRSLLEMVEDVMSQPLTIVEDEVPTADKLSDEETLDMIMKMIPNIEVSEIGWSDVRTNEKGEAISGPQRSLLEDYLNNIKGNTFEERIDYVSMFYAAGAGVIGASKDQSRTGRITQAISYLVFYKTLTKVITNFNASSAGFSFESFLSALVKGQQIQTGNKTIADYTDNLTNQEIPVSLKLYREGGLEVGGSYTDLVNDLVEPKFDFDGMRYVVCTKELEGEDLEQEGEIKFWQFDFTLDNVMWILMNSKEKSAECIRIPQAVKSKIEGKGAEVSEEGYENILGLPLLAALPSADEVYEDIYVPKFKQQLQHLRGPSDKPNLLSLVLRSDREVVEFLDALDWVKNDALFKDEFIEIEHAEDQPESPEPGATAVKQREMKPKTRGISSMVGQKVKAWARDWARAYWQALESDPEKNAALYKHLKFGPNSKTGKERTERQRETELDRLGAALATVTVRANNKMKKRSKGQKRAESYNPMLSLEDGVLGVLRASEIEAERKAMIKAVLETEGGFLTPEQSATLYAQTKNPMFKKTMLKHSLGYLTTKHFSLNQTQATNGAAPGPDKIEDTPTEKDPRATKVVKGGTGAEYLGEIKVGAKYVAEAMEGVRDILNEEILGIFSALKALSDNLNSFFAGGLKNDNLAGAAVGNAYSIGTAEPLQTGAGSNPMLSWATGGAEGGIDENINKKNK